MSNTRIYWLHALSPVHVGIGRGVGYIDLPIDRDSVTGWPIIRGSAFKGVWADHYAVTLIPEPEEEEVDGKTRQKDRRKMDTPEGKLLKAAFGTAGDANESNSGALIPTDARLVCLPVRSFRGTFAWATSPMCLRVLRRTLELAGETDLPDAPASLPDTDAHHFDEAGTTTALKEGEKIYLEDLDFSARPCSVATRWAGKIAAWAFPDDGAWQAEFKRRFVVLPDAAFDFLCETGTEVHSRVRVDDGTKTVARGALWTEESLPTETLLAGIVQCDRVFGGNGQEITHAGLLDRFASKPLALQIGGKATIGRGQVRCVFTPVSGGGQ